jgi:hypothetical protein
LFENLAPEVMCDSCLECFRAAAILSLLADEESLNIERAKIETQNTVRAASAGPLGGSGFGAFNEAALQSSNSGPYTSTPGQVTDDESFHSTA